MFGKIRKIPSGAQEFHTRPTNPLRVDYIMVPDDKNEFEPDYDIHEVVNQNIGFLSRGTKDEIEVKQDLYHHLKEK